MTIAVRLMTLDDIGTSEDYIKFLRQHRNLHRMLGAMYALGRSDIRAMLRHQDRKFGQRGRAARVSSPLTRMAAASAISSGLTSVAFSRFVAEYGEDMNPRARAAARQRRTMEF